MIKVRFFLKIVKALATAIGCVILIFFTVIGMYQFRTTLTQLFQNKPEQIIIYNRSLQILEETLTIEPNESYEFEHSPRENSMIEVRIKATGFGEIQLPERAFAFSNTSSMVFRIYFTGGQHPPYIIKLNSDRVSEVNIEIREFW